MNPLAEPPGPPSGQLVTHSDASTITISFIAPEDTGRTDTEFWICYSPLTEIGSAVCDDPVPLDTSSRLQTYTIRGLDAFTSYFMAISSHNGVSDQDSENDRLRDVSLVGDTTEGGK